MQMGPESRIHPRSVGTRKKSTASRLAPDFFKMVRTRDSDSRFSTSRNTRSTLDKCRTISAKAHGKNPRHRDWRRTFSRWFERAIRIRGFPPAEIRARPSTNAARSPRRPTEWARIFRANRSVRAASRARWLRGVPIRRACGSRVRTAFWIVAVSSLGKEFNTEIAEKKRPDRLSKGILFFVQPAAQDGLIGVDAAVAEKRPVAACVLAFCGIAFDDEDFLFIVR